MNAVETQAVSKIYRTDTAEIRAVEHVSITVATGEFVALVGPSGSGKTTLLALLAGLLQPSAGEVIIGEQRLGLMSASQLTRFRMQQIGFTFQAHNLVPYLTVLENVELMLRLSGRYDRPGRVQAQKLLERLGLGDRMHTLPAKLSGGQQQRAAIARALVHNPPLVLADEPTASLDTERAYQVVQIFADLIHEQGRAGIMVTHDLRMCRYVNRVIQMMDGHLVRIITDPAEIQALTHVGEPLVQRIE